MFTWGAPEGMEHLHGTWVRDDEVPLVNGRVHYTSGATSVFYQDQHWWIADRDAPDALVYACSMLPTNHTHAIPSSHWVGRVRCFPDEWVQLTSFRFEFQLAASSSPEFPVDLREVGTDLFVWRTPSRPIWFTEPVHGALCYSGAKTHRDTGTAGVRFCPYCRVCTSANNFVTQHMRCVHPELYPPRPPPPPPPPRRAPRHCGRSNGTRKRRRV